MNVYYITLTSVDKHKKLYENIEHIVAETADLALRKCLDLYSNEVLTELATIQIEVGEEVTV